MFNVTILRVLFRKCVIARKLTYQLSVVALAVAPAASTAQDLVIEAGAGGQNNHKYEEHYGKWMDSRIPPQIAKSWAPGLSKVGEVGARKTVFSGPNIVPTGPAMARFTPNFDKRDHYFVYVTWPRGANAGPVRYVIKHAGGSEVKKLIQNGWGAPGSECNASTWILLGDYDFAPSTEQYIELHVEPDVQLLEENWYGQAYADAVCFSRQPLTDLGLAMSPQAPPVWPGNEPPTVLAATPMPWRAELAKGWQEAQTANLPLLLFFFSDDAYLDYFENTLFVNPEVQSSIVGKLVPIRIDMKKDKELAYKLGIFRAGTIAVYTSKGDPIKVIRNPLAPEDFVKELSGL